MVDKTMSIEIMEGMLERGELNNENTYLDESADGDGSFIGEIYADYRDGFDKDAIKEFFEHDGNNLDKDN